MCMPEMHLTFVCNQSGRIYVYELDTGRCIGALVVDLKKQDGFKSPPIVSIAQNTITVALKEGRQNDFSLLEADEDEGPARNLAIFFVWDIFSMCEIALAVSVAAQQRCTVACLPFRTSSHAHSPPAATTAALEHVVAVQTRWYGLCGTFELRGIVPSDPLEVSAHPAIGDRCVCLWVWQVLPGNRWGAQAIHFS